MQGQNIGSIYGSFELDNRGFKSELKKTERETDKLIAALNKSGKVKVDTAQWKKLTAEMGALNKRAHDTQIALLKAPAGTPEAKKLSGELKNLESRIRMIKKVTDPTTKAIKDMAKANQAVAGSSKAVGGGGGAPGGMRQFGGAFAQQAAGRMGGLGGALSMGMSAGPYVAAAVAIVGAIAGIGIAAKKTADALKQMTTEAADWAQDTILLSASTGVSVDMLQRLQHISATMNLSYEGITRGIGLLIKKMPEIASGSGAAAQAFARLGISATDSSGQLRSMDDLVREVIAKLQELPNTTERGALAAEIFGRGWMELAPILSLSADEFRGAMEAAGDLGLVLSGREMTALMSYQGALDDVAQATKGVKLQIASALGPILHQAVQPFVDALPKAIEKLKTWLDSLKPSLAVLAESFKKAWAAFKPLVGEIAKDTLNFIANAVKTVAWLADKIVKVLPRIVAFLTMCYRSSFYWLSVVRRVFDVLARILHLPPVEMPDWGEPPEINAVDVEDVSDALSKQEQLAADARSEVESLRRQIALAGDSSAAAAMSWEILNGKYREASDATKKLLMDTAKLKDAADARIESNKKYAASIVAVVDAAKSFFSVVKQRAAESVRLMEQFANATIDEVKRQADEEKRIRDEAASDAKTHYEKLSELGRAGALAKTGISMFGEKTAEVPISYSADKVSAAAAAVTAGRAAEAKVRAAVEGQLFGGAISRQRAIAGAVEPPWEEIKTYLTGSTNLLGQLAEFASVLPLLMLEVRRATRPAVESGI